MAATRYPPAAWRPVRNTSGTMVLPTRGLIPHVQQGNGSLFGWFNNPASEVSSHLWVSKGGTVEQYVELDRKAWAQADGNPYWISVECEGYDTEDYTPIQVQRLAELYAWGIAEFGWKAEITDSVNGYGIGTHRMGGAAWGAHSCPGSIRADRRSGILQAALATSGDVTSSSAQQRYVNMPTLRPGDRGNAVVTLQNALNIIFGHEAPTGDPNRLVPDGAFGQRTQARVGSLQRLNSPYYGPITADGVVGRQSWLKIGYILTGMNRWV
ncbi:N-acetylmuramoyl-L-alanine amidase [Frankia sp. CNm7]|uniref:N-acetylmuramoyl-L-alanine amidase n=1 Tax=Frankia nepalensis TaxID=1836974 RepID=A0A937UR39_9ACTN|nr:N-acetylmuramoyl-L-alanine amidase [Frankia nepalensis]MBL7497528.1 N-acetylmuramoyl-L-alanine amidase [Frankia nepalensis]MBL7510206.1 N-acetylmuramoyl-L-alanine amidase [Frankia nepalensis]MBL7524439.1 N-acetylmuramoyl-L-alanine amidase [Frankia nepalensis]MBL7630917.1 N-acetylmuramoyl-L-alanine amidase [Frankia nepalensis]